MPSFSAASTRAAPRLGQEFELDAQVGLPERLPEGERLLWQGAPSVRDMAVHAFHARKVAIYFVLLVVWHVVSSLHDGAGLRATLASGAWLVAMGSLAVGCLTLLGLWSARTTLYTLTDQRIVMRVGIVLTVAYNLPLTRIHAADVRRVGRSQDIVLTLEPNTRIAWLQLWPHVLPWRLSRPRPALRALHDAPAVSNLLVKAWSHARAQALRSGDNAAATDASAQPRTGLHPGLQGGSLA
jgi:hypothetical protein